MKLFPFSRLATLLSVAILSPSSIGLLGAAPSPTTFAVTNTNDSGAGSLRQAILNANTTPGRDEIVFRLGGGSKTITLTSGQLEITDSVFISGTGRDRLTISGNNASRVFQVNSGVDVTLRELSIVNGQNDSGGGILNLGKLDIRNAALRDNTGLKGGGAIVNGNGSVPNSEATLTVDNVQFTNNRAEEAGAGINNFGTAIVRDSTFSNNAGSGIAQRSRTLIVDRSTFSNNKARMGGGILAHASLTVRNSNFRENQAELGGGIVAMSVPMSTIEDCTFSGNTAIAGGAIASRAALAVNDSKFISNKASNNGGAIYSDYGFVIVNSSNFSSNTATNGGGGIYSLKSLAVRSSTLTNNQATKGGGIGALGVDAVVEDSTFSENTAAQGGGIYSTATLTVNNSNFRANKAFSTNSALPMQGGGIYNQGVGLFSYSTFTSNTATGEGGAIYATSYYGKGELMLEFSTLENNQAANAGGVFNGMNNTVRVRESKIRKNTATTASPNLNGAFTSEGGNDIGDTTGSTGFVNGLSADRIGLPTSS